MAPADRVYTLRASPCWKLRPLGTWDGRDGRGSTTFGYGPFGWRRGCGGGEGGTGPTRAARAHLWQTAWRTTEVSSTIRSAQQAPQPARPVIEGYCSGFGVPWQAASPERRAGTWRRLKARTGPGNECQRCCDTAPPCGRRHPGCDIGLKAPKPRGSDAEWDVLAASRHRVFKTQCTTGKGCQAASAVVPPTLLRLSEACCLPLNT